MPSIQNRQLLPLGLLILLAWDINLWNHTVTNQVSILKMSPPSKLRHITLQAKLILFPFEVLKFTYTLRILFQLPSSYKSRWARSFANREQYINWVFTPLISNVNKIKSLSIKKVIVLSYNWCSRATNFFHMVRL